ncbi:MAG: type 4a pilus biogenesis protein PilO [Armatimonadota bacterium]|nr:type 4a pilus biogenesis protein PilO [Armatimonadota bacterium]MDR7450393.1 type 4a pilus biogenesis protein PilO [Armatimonadota bacterium]MDR7467024.1 type 4a pilus biogenesis protein PilO [Armatimonadota bacterium]MDR7493434.1 type 4a pilus biogenesis protein PilO [Armatimonadota bacterium]MDR7498699.1 type 4a pilus biogenesis protein PilO [Armatimonadota bacterium]
MSRRERMLLIVGLVVVVLLGFYYYGYLPRQARYRELRAQLTDRQTQLSRMEAMVRDAPRLEQEYAGLQATIARLEALLPSDKETAVLLVQLEQTTRSLGITLQAVRPSALEGPRAQAPPGAPPSGRPAPGAPPAAGQPAPGTPAPAPAIEYRRYPIQLSINASYAELLRLMTAFQEFPRLIVVRKIGVTPRQVPDLTASLDIETYVLPKEAR